MGGVRHELPTYHIISLGTKYHIGLPIRVSNTYHIIPITITNNISLHILIILILIIDSPLPTDRFKSSGVLPSA